MPHISCFPQALLTPIAMDSLDQALVLADGLPRDQATLLVANAKAAFDHAYVGVAFAGVVMMVALALALVLVAKPRASIGRSPAGR